MKKNFTSISKFFCFLLFISISNNLLAQPANDRCDNPEAVSIAPNETSVVYITGDTRMAEDAVGINDNYPDVCSNGLFTDDVWFSVTTGATVPQYGITVKTEFGSNTTDIAGVGMAIYEDCNAGRMYFDCFSNNGRTDITFPASCLSPMTTYLVRVWSGGAAATDQGTFEIGAYETENPIPSNSLTTVLWEETFDNGLGDWTTTTTAADTNYVWRPFYNDLPNAFGTTEGFNNGIPSFCGTVGYAGGWYQGGMTGDVSVIGPPPYLNLVSDLISPPIDLSNVTTPVNLQFDQAVRRLNPNGGPIMFVSFSYDDGVTWQDTIDANENLEIQVRTSSTERIRMIGAQGNSAVRIKFTYNLDFYYWLIDNVKIVERENNNLQVNENWYAVAHNAITPKSQLSPIGFMVDVENVGRADQTNVNLNMTVENEATGAVAFTENLDYGTIQANGLIENQIMANFFVPDEEAAAYVATYDIMSDSMDFDESNDMIPFRFEVSDSIFAREFGDAPAGISPGNPATVNWSYGAYYYVPNGDGQEVTSVLFNIANGDNENLVGGNVSITLYKWEDVNNDGVSQAAERGASFTTPPVGGAIVGFSSHTIALNDADIQLPLENWDDPADPVLLEDDAHYVLVCGFTSPGGVTDQIAIGAISGNNNNTDYAPMNFVQNEAFMNPFYNAFFGTSPDFETDLTSSFFWAPRIRMHVNPFEPVIDGTNDILDETNKISIYPNPASQIMNLKLNLTSVFEEGTVKITDATGKVMNIQIYENIQTQLFTYDISEYPAGNYFVQFISEEGSRTERFSVVK